MPLPHAPDIARSDFIALYGGIYEHSPWVAEGVYDAGLSETEADPERLAARMAAVVAAAPEATRLALIRAHPDLAGKAAVAGELTAASTAEQAGAGLDRCTPEEFARFNTLNQAYRDKFGFPMVIAVAGLNRHDILMAFERRIGNSRQTEFGEALAQIDLIAKLRLKAMAAHGA